MAVAGGRASDTRMRRCPGRCVRRIAPAHAPLQTRGNIPSMLRPDPPEGTSGVPPPTVRIAGMARLFFGSRRPLVWL